MAEELQSGMRLARDLFLSEYDTSPFISKGIVLNQYVIDKIRERGFSNIYVEEDAQKASRPAASSALPVLEPEVRDEALEVLEEIFCGLDNAEGHQAVATLVLRVENVVDKMVDSILSERNTLVNINDLKSYDDYTYHHSLSVAVLSLAMGQSLGYPAANLKRLGFCAMMHDVGKTAIPVEIIRKNAHLDQNEMSLMKTHSVAGYSYLVEAGVGDEEIWNGVLSHHEKMDGTGYPSGLRGKEIPEWSRIISVADVYDALTSNRPYRKPMEPAEAIEYIMGGTGSSFDIDMVYALLKKVDLYPLGSRVELSDGRLAVVVNNENQMRPTIRLEDGGEAIDLFRDRHYLSLVIKRVVGE